MTQTVAARLTVSSQQKQQKQTRRRALWWRLHAVQNPDNYMLLHVTTRPVYHSVSQVQLNLSSATVH